MDGTFSQLFSGKYFRPWLDTENWKKTWRNGLAQIDAYQSQSFQYNKTLSTEFELEQKVLVLSVMLKCFKMWEKWRTEEAIFIIMNQHGVCSIFMVRHYQRYAWATLSLINEIHYFHCRLVYILLIRRPICNKQRWEQRAGELLWCKWQGWRQTASSGEPDSKY